MRRQTMSLACGASLFIPVLVHAHHSPAAYDLSKEVILDGTIAQVDWANPHIYLTLELDGPDGRRLQQVEVVSVAAARSGGLRREHLPIGSDVIVRAHPNRRGSEHTVLGSDVTLPDGTTYALNTTGRSSRPPAAAIAATDLSGSWAPRFDPLLVPLAHAWPLTEKARAALAETMSRPTPSDCAASPPPMLMQLPQLRTIEVGDDAVVISVDADGNSAVRTVHLGAAEHPEDVAPSLLGHSIGRWEGATLVIDTVGFEPHWTGIGFGVPSGAGKRLVG